MEQSKKTENAVIMSWISEGSTVLDLGCGDGELLARLIEEKNVRSQGIELNDEAIQQCVARGLSVFQEDIDSGLADYADGSFDFVVLNQTFQQVKKPDFVLREALRVGKKVIISFPNFCYIKDRFQIFFRGRVPVTASLPYEWFDTPNLHFLSIADFREYCRNRGYRIEKSIFVNATTKIRFLPNLFAQVGIFLLTR